MIYLYDQNILNLVYFWKIISNKQIYIKIMLVYIRHAERGDN
jgi:hypothetical protein